MNIFVFDIETVPDTAGGKKLHDFTTLNDQEIADALFAKRREKVGHDFLPLHMQRIVAISVVFYFNNQLKIWSLGQIDSPEEELIQRFFDGIDKYTPQLISWNGSGFDLPVLHYRALLHKITAPRYWEKGDNDNHFKWNNYLSRYHYRHLDLMDVLAAYQPRANAPLDEIATLCGFPGKMGMSGAHVWQAFQNNQLQSIRDYCETDVLNTYLVYLRFELIRGQLSEEEYQANCDQLRNHLQEQNKPHFNDFLEKWEE